MPKPTATVLESNWPAGKLNYTAFHKNIPVGISGCKKNRLNNGTFF